ncbi:class I SAM-dependent methyltransferase [Primorskyibacter aestuariivivens]|uniref:class I SAM-dependent methyltransferase n=1 Tax=Primorskyibacter aestuariivivens TaxID=1888912 RepID=UPI002300CF68|nr:class I SAM-dependent methyltransferase [Primorskyibacter aestuariivivens]MDA7428065.1 class I SAM-dependent methyltransferase [Primorskyibacter aestuariivivens]
MAVSRLSLALGELALPDTGGIAVFEPTAETDLSALPADRVQIITRHITTQDAFPGFACQRAPTPPLATAIVVVPRAKALAQALIAEAVAACPDGLILVDGQKTDGVDPLFKACRARVDIAGQMTKAHGRAFWFASHPAFDDWRAAPQSVDGFQTVPGVFSADGIDPASALLAQHLPAKPGATVADLGAGWGYLAAQILRNPDIQNLHLVESDAAALDCARANIDDPRAVFHWADATTWKAPEPLDCVIMNPPFHQGRKGAPDLGQRFITNAARLLKPSGQLVLVANRHLPYEATLAACFAKTDEIGGDKRFKILAGQRPTRGKARASLG